LLRQVLGVLLRPLLAARLQLAFLPAAELGSTRRGSARLEPAAKRDRSKISPAKVRLRGQGDFAGRAACL
jgi:hypothetical protein